MKNRGELPSALTHYFDPPEGHTGEFGWICGYSADKDFLAAALERFTGLAHDVRANEGSISIALMLDPSNPQITPVEVPGLLHVAYVEQAVRPFRLLHAKVALLGFRHEKSDAFVLRLVVSTGNLTRDTLERSIDLAWYADVSSAELARPVDSVRNRSADLAAAVELFSTLRGWFDLGLLLQPPRGRDISATTLRHERFVQWLDAARRLAGGRCRLIDSRRLSLLSQLPDKVREIAGGSVRNRLLLGSGFFENATSRETPARSLTTIVERLRGEGLLTRDAPAEVFANRTTCHGLKDLCGKPKWTIHEGKWPSEPDRTLHAKFIFSGFTRSDSNSCGSAWLYLGSGNLTAPGFMHKADAGSGNLEAGVVLAAPGLEWPTLPQCLPVAVDGALQLSAADIQTQTTEEKDRGLGYIAAPVHAFVVDASRPRLRLIAQPEHAAASIDLLDKNGAPCARDGDAFFWNSHIQRMLDVRWRRGDEVRHVRVPLLDEFGRVAGADLPSLTLEDAWDELAEFPAIFPEPRDTDTDGQMPRNPAVGSTSHESRYALRRTMELVERIAATQCALPEAEWTRWCLRLEQTLTRTASSDAVCAVRELGYNVLSPLLEPEFRPDFALQGVADDRYRGVMSNVSIAWQMHDLPNLEPPA